MANGAPDHPKRNQNVQDTRVNMKLSQNLNKIYSFGITRIRSKTVSEPVIFVFIGINRWYTHLFFSFPPALNLDFKAYFNALSTRQAIEGIKLLFFDIALYDLSKDQL